MYYGQPPVELGQYKVDCKEMMFYQYYPIKLKDVNVQWEDRLDPFMDLAFVCIRDFVKTFGILKHTESYVYLSAKYLFQPENCPYNRPGWHCDGFMTDDINYIWSDKNPTVFNTGKFNLTQDDKLSIQQMNEQADSANNFSYPNNTLIRLDQYNVHKVADVQESGMRTFFKLSFSKDKYDLLGNSHNYLLDYNWEMKPRSIERNIPQTIL